MSAPKRFFASIAMLSLMFFSSSPAFALLDDDAQDNLTSILEAIEINGPSEAAIADLQNFIKTYPRSDVTDEAVTRLAGIYMNKKAFNDAAKLYQRVLVEFPSSKFRFEALYGLGFCQYRQGKHDDARTALEGVVASFEAPLSFKVKSRLILDQLTAVASASGAADKAANSGGSYAIGAVLPLSGDYADYGERALKGVLLAANVFGGIGTPIEVFVRDSGSTEDSAKEAVAEAARIDRVVGIVGPLLSKTAVAAVTSADRKHVPIIALTQKDGVPEVGDYVFRNFLTMEQQASTLASYSAAAKGFSRFAVMYPQNPYGTEFVKLFKEKVEAHGAKVVAEVPYAQGQADFSKELTALFGLRAVEKLDGRRHVTEYTPTVKIDALFIPDGYDAAVQIAAHVALYNIKGTTLLGANLWNSDEILRLGGRHVEGAVFVDAFFAGSGKRATLDFVGTFRTAYGYTPGLLEAESFDSAMMMIAALEAGNGSRGAVRDALAGYTEFEGATGRIGFDSEGEARKDLFILTVRDNRIIELVPAQRGAERK
jgi:ABC-type branched-subunit amino acid transport system substrate-binding protein